MFFKFYNISGKTLSIVALSALPFYACAQDDKTLTTAPTTITSPAAPAMPSTPKDNSPDTTVPVTIPTTMEPATMPLSPTAQPEGTNTLLITPAPTIPAADNSLIDKAVSAMSANNVDDFTSIFDNSNFLFITLNGDKVTSMPELKVQWGAMFGATGTLKGVKATLTPGKVMELSPGAASYDGSIVFTTAENKTIRALITGAMKFSDSAWKINTMHLSSNDLVKMQDEAEFKKKNSGSSGTFMALLLGLVIGVVGMMYYSKSKQPKQAQ